jgi:hypothetical protein
MFVRHSGAACLGALLVSFAGFAQVNVGRISGTVTDASAAAVAGAQATITNEATKIQWKAVTDAQGFYVATNLPTGQYAVRVESKGFRSIERSGIALPDDGRITADFKLEVGAVSSTIEVVAAKGETINTVSGEVSRVIDAEQVQDLALNGRNYMELVTLVPGVAVTSLDQMGTTTSLSVSNQSINGNRTDSNHLMIDGGMNLDSGSNGSQINNVGIDFVDQVKVQTSAFSAEYGRNSGGSINVVTRSGGASFHGSLFETIRNDAVDAQDYFAPVKPELRFNDYGWSLGGPIAFGPLKKGKLFFFAGEEWKKIRRFTNPSRQTLPTLAEIGGDFTDRTSQVINAPGTKNPLPSKNLTNLVTADGKAVLAVYSAMIKLAAAYSNTPTANNATFQVLNPFNWREDIARIDYRPTDSQSIYVRYLHDSYNTIDLFGTFNASALPDTPTLRDRPSNGPQLGWTWTLKPTLINEVKFNSSWNSQRTPLQGDAWDRAAYGFQFPRIYGGNGRYTNGIPDVTITSFASYNGPARVFLASPTTDLSLSEKMTWVHGRHEIKFGTMIVRNRKDQNGRSIYDGSVAFSTSDTQTTSFPLADAALGNFATYSEAGSDPTGFFRFTQIESFVEDSWHVTPKLSIVAGVRVSYYGPIYTVQNNMVNWVPYLYDPKKAVTVNAAGTLTIGSGNPYNGLIRAGAGIPADQLGRVPGGNSPTALAIPAGAPRGLYDASALVMPRFSFAYRLFNDNKTVLRGGFGTFHDRTQGNIIFSQTLLAPYSFQSVFQNGNLSNPAGGASPAAAVQGSIHGLDPHLAAQAIYNFNFGIQRELPQGFFLDVTYAGNQGRHMYRSPNINEPSFDALVANQLGAKAATNSLVPYLGWSTINYYMSDANANYNALQTYLTRRRGNAIMTVSYTWSKSLAEANAYNDAGDAVEGTERHFNYGPTSFDRRHIFVATYTYRIPLLRGRKDWAGKAFGGWEISGVTRFQTGAELTPTGSTSIGTRRSSYLGGPASLPSDQRGPNHWFNTAAFATAPATLLGNAGVGVITAPGWENWDLSLRKIFRITERVSLKFQADTFNALNHVNFDSPNVTTSATAFGSVSSAEPMRNIQFGLRLGF